MLTTAHDVVFEQGGRRLLRFRRTAPASYREPVLFCYALVNRPYILDLLPGKSVVERYLERGFEVYMIDWGAPSASARALTLDHYVRVLLKHAVERVLLDHGSDRLHLVGYCMGGTMSALLSALYPALVETLTLLAAPVDFAGSRSLLNVWTDARYFDVDALLGAFGNCPALLLQTSFLLMKPVQNLFEKYVSLLEHLNDRDFVTTFRAIERWTNDNIPVAGETFRDFVTKLYQGNQLTQGRLRLGDEPIDLRRITCPLLMLTADADHLVPPASTLGIRDCVGSREVCALNIDAGHVGLVVSSRSHREIWPQATRWLADRSTASAAAAQLSDGLR